MLEKEVKGPPPTPEFPMKPEEKEFFLAEQAFLKGLTRVIAPGIIDPPQVAQAVFSRLEDLSSTQMTTEVFEAYGLTGNPCQSDKSLGTKYNKSYHTVNTDRKVVIQSLWLLYNSHFSEELNPFVTKLKQRYILSPQDAKDHQTARTFKRAEANINYSLDREFLLAIEEDLLPLLKGLYGGKTRDSFAKFYRLGTYKGSETFERQGNSSFPPKDSQLTQEVTDFLEVGRATAEHIADIHHGTRPWINLRGDKKIGYSRKGGDFPSVLKDYQQQVTVQEALTYRSLNLHSLERELLEKTTKARLGGETKLSALDEFNQKHGTHVSRTDLRALERKAVNGLEFNRIVRTQREQMIKVFLGSPECQRELSGLLQDLLFDYHVEKMLSRRAARAVNLDAEDTMNVEQLAELRRCLDRLMTAELPGKGHINDAMIKAYFKDDKMPQELLDVIKRFAGTETLLAIASSLDLELGNPSYGLGGLRRMTITVVENYQRKSAAASQKPIT